MTDSIGEEENPREGFDEREERTSQTTQRIGFTSFYWTEEGIDSSQDFSSLFDEETVNMENAVTTPVRSGGDAASGELSRSSSINESEQEETTESSPSFAKEATNHIKEEAGEFPSAVMTKVTAASDDPSAGNRSLNTCQSSSSSVSDGNSSSALDPTRWRQSITTPTENDVLLGRGEQANRHPGNIRFRKEGDKLMRSYQAAERSLRKVIAEKLACKVEEWGGLFLKKCGEDTWKVADKRTAIEKCQHVLREKKAKRKNPPEADTEP